MIIWRNSRHTIQLAIDEAEYFAQLYIEEFPDLSTAFFSHSM
jgi:hypothetical protein